MSIPGENRPCWFVGATWSGTKDQAPRFLQEGIWENGFKNKHLDVVRSIKPGDRIAIKSTYTRKHGLPFDNKGHSVSVMAVKAVGIVTQNMGDGRILKVEWTPFEPPREWFFYTYQPIIWKVTRGKWTADALIDFTFNDQPQDIDRFRSDPFWSERFGDDKHRFQWTRFYSAVADKLLDYQNDREALVGAIHEISTRVDGLSHLQDQFEDGATRPLEDICPFTTFGVFNRGLTDENRIKIAKELAEFLGVEELVPDSFEGIPVLNNQRSWFFRYQKDRGANDIDVLWKVFAEALCFADSEDDEGGNGFVDAYDQAAQLWGVNWNLTMGLYWIRPWAFPTLDQQSRTYIMKKLGVRIGLNGPKKNCSADDYLKVKSTLETRFAEEAYSVHSFPELSWEAFRYKDPKPIDDDQGEEGDDPQPEVITVPIDPYSIDDIMDDGCFLEPSELKRMLERLRTKKNLILQGPPGTGKTWLSKRLAMALIGLKDESKIKAVQFHPNLSYEDFIRGWRPEGDGKLSMVDGPFMEMVKVAMDNPSDNYVVVIEEINRGNPAQIFGEMLTLLEADKRTPDEALELCYRRADNERVFIPDNLYVIGTMNIADRSLALVDFALRRRFAFIDLEPCLGESWKKWLVDEYHLDPVFVSEIQQRMIALNDEIEADTSLGRQFRVGHSYVTPSLKMRITDAGDWFKEVVKTEIGPLLEEYWFDSLDKARKASQKLIEGF